jgi:hypothetical protein
MSVGIKAFYVMLSFILALSIVAGLGIPDLLNMSHSATYDEDVNAVIDAMTSQEQPNTGTSTFADFTIGGGRALHTGWQVIGNTKGVVMLITGVPESVAAPVQSFFRIAFGLSFAQFIRGVVIN